MNLILIVLLTLAFANQIKVLSLNTLEWNNGYQTQSMGINPNYATINQWLITSNWSDKSLIQYGCYSNCPGCLSISFTFSESIRTNHNYFTITIRPMPRVSSHGHITPADESPTPTTAPVGISRELGLILKVFHLPSDHFHLICSSIRSLPLDFLFHPITSTWFSLPCRFHFFSGNTCDYRQDCRRCRLRRYWGRLEVFPWIH